MHEVVDPKMLMPMFAVECLALRQFIVMMRKREIDAARMDIQFRAQDVGSHN